MTEATVNDVLKKVDDTIVAVQDAQATVTGLQRDTAAGLMDKARAEVEESLQRARDINR